eukprot:CCRYP_021046-RA/>CCRYP_021046-RA protein AED:0.09 eAED:0.09 QI:373/1/0.5/1/0/0/2/0/234
MPKCSSIEDFIRHVPLLEAGAVVHTASSFDQIILAVPTRLADSFEEECIDTSELSQEDIQRIRDEDPFMYHSILQHFRKIRSSSFAPDRDGVDDELGWGSRYPADTAAGGHTISRTNFRQTVTVNNNPGPTAQASNDQTATSSEQSISPLRFSSSTQQVSSSSSWHRVSTFSPYSTSIVTRKRRISAEADYRKEMAELVTSLSVHPRPDLASIFDFDDSGGDFDKVDLSFLELE